jgi:hypothetical protein
MSTFGRTLSTLLGCLALSAQATPAMCSSATRRHSIQKRTRRPQLAAPSRFTPPFVYGPSNILRQLAMKCRSRRAREGRDLLVSTPATAGEKTL